MTASARTPDLPQANPAGALSALSGLSQRTARRRWRHVLRPVQARPGKAESHPPSARADRNPGASVSDAEAKARLAGVEPHAGNERKAAAETEVHVALGKLS